MHTFCLLPQILTLIWCSVYLFSFPGGFRPFLLSLDASRLRAPEVSLLAVGGAAAAFTACGCYGVVRVRGEKGLHLKLQLSHAL